MNPMKAKWTTSAVVVTALSAGALLAAMPAHAEMSAEELAKLAQNPVGNLISVPFQNNTNLNFGPEKGTQNILNIQPVIPISINNEWNIITRTIVPVISMPSLDPGDRPDQRHRRHGVHRVPVAGRAQGRDLGCRAGGAAARPNSNAELGNKNWGLGPSVRRAAPRKGQSLGVRRAGQQHLVADQRQAGRILQQRPDPAVRQLQLPEVAST